MEHDDVEELAPTTPVRLISFDTYASAQTAVDTLSDRGFPVSSVSIVWSGLRRVEHVTGRRTTVSAALEGAIGGAWFGTLFGLLMALLIDLPEGTTVIGVTFTYLVVGALAGAVWRAVSHALLRGQRDFSTAAVLDAERYELWVHPQTAGLAADILGLRSSPDGSRLDPDGSRLDPDGRSI